MLFHFSCLSNQILFPRLWENEKHLTDSSIHAIQHKSTYILLWLLYTDSWRQQLRWLSEYCLLWGGGCQRTPAGHLIRQNLLKTDAFAIHPAGHAVRFHPTTPIQESRVYPCLLCIVERPWTCHQQRESSLGRQIPLGWICPM